MKKEIPLRDNQVAKVKELNLEMLENTEQAKTDGEPFSALKGYSDARNEQLEEYLDPKFLVEPGRGHNRRSMRMRFDPPRRGPNIVKSR